MLESFFLDSTFIIQSRLKFGGNHRFYSFEYFSIRMIILIFRCFLCFFLFFNKHHTTCARCCVLWNPILFFLMYCISQSWISDPLSLFFNILFFYFFSKRIDCSLRWCGLGIFKIVNFFLFQTWFYSCSLPS